MMKSKLLIFILMFFAASAVCAQEATDTVPEIVADIPTDTVASPRGRVVTAVETDEKAPRRPTLHYYDKSGKPLKEPVYLFTELDTVRKVRSGPKYPVYNGVSVGLNFFDAVMRIAGQKYMSFDVAADVSLWNWLFPVAEFGVGFADSHPEDSNFRYRGLPSFYGKIGFNYNFLYKSSPEYQVFVGFRAGYSAFRYRISDIDITSGYWGQTNLFDLPTQHAQCWYGEALAGLKVRIYRNFFMGWTLRYRFKFSEKQGAESKPWFVPGYGASSPFGFTFSVIWNIPARRKPAPDEVAGQ